MSRTTLRINEVFCSIQGESTWAGCPCVFIRLTGCHLRCTYCDTSYAFHEGSNREINDLLHEALSHDVPLVEITGGEPLLQPPVHSLMARLCDAGRTVLVETSGACDISACDPRVIRIMDVKTPGSGESDRNLLSNLDHLTSRDEVKFVITDRADFDWAAEFIRTHHLTDRVKAVLFSPAFEQASNDDVEGCAGLPLRDLAQWLLESPLPLPGVRLQTQLHKFIWDPLTRGV